MSTELGFGDRFVADFCDRSDEEFTSVVSSAAAEMTATATTSDGAATSTAAAASSREGRVQAAFLGIGALMLAGV